MAPQSPTAATGTGSIATVSTSVSTGVSTSSSGASTSPSATLNPTSGTSTSSSGTSSRSGPTTGDTAGSNAANSEGPFSLGNLSLNVVNGTFVGPSAANEFTYVAHITDPYNASANVTATIPYAVVLPVTFTSDGAPPFTTSAVIPLQTPSTSTIPTAVPAALGAVLGVVAVIGTILVALLLRKNRQLHRAARDARESAAMEQAAGNYSLASYGKETEVVSQDDSPAQLKRQLAQVRQELAAVTVLTPSTIRDQSDYVRDLTLLNDNIRQLSMRINHDRPDVPAAVLRTKICAALWSAIFTRFDAGLDGSTEQHMSDIMNQFKKPSTALLWKAMTVQNLPLANPAKVAPTVEQDLAASIGAGVQPGQTVEVV